MSEPLYEAVCVGAHPDDVEIGMGATVAKMVALGRMVAIVDLTDGEPTPHGTPEVRAREAADSARVLGVERRTLSQPNRFLFDSIEARMELAEVLREFRPRLLFVPYPEDAHPDHVAASAIATAARFYAKLTKTAMTGEPFYPPRVVRYMAVHQRIVAQPSFIVDVTDVLEQKMQALAQYRSQFSDNPGNASVLAMVEETARYWGTLARVGAGEPFFATEPLALASPDAVL